MEYRPEIVVGLVGPVGTDLRLAAAIVAEILGDFRYDVPDPISLSGLLDAALPETRLPDARVPRDEYIDVRMDAGNELRRNLGRGDALAVLAMQAIVRVRAGATETSAADSLAYVLRSLKHPEEVAALRRTYRERFILIGAHAPRQRRLERLADEIAQSRGSTSRRDWLPRAHQLANRDDAEESDRFGQNVRGTFPLADFFVDVSSREAATVELRRFLRAVFGYQFASPTPDEYAMFHAAAAAVRSADLSRQVGAAVATDRGDIVAVGCNEVPAFGGGAYWHGDINDGRDCARGEDANARLRNTAIEEIRTILTDPRLKMATKRLRDLDADSFRDILGDTRVDELTEFNRAVHAEMSAILDAARRGMSVRCSTLYTTTFPCHNCAKHIVGAGITRVVYVEPYAKSLAEELHPDTIAIDRVGTTIDRVRFEQFVGVAPSIYMPLYGMGTMRRKQGGRRVEYDAPTAAPKLVPRGDLTYLERERFAIDGL